ncbi:MAG TPA: hypothetical protein VH186_33190 [Chloroflexia bacterium]|nr:hypothetical protein [Chloroflexia bacterium]
MPVKIKSGYFLQLLGLLILSALLAACGEATPTAPAAAKPTFPVTTVAPGSTATVRPTATPSLTTPGTTLPSYTAAPAITTAPSTSYHPVLILNTKTVKIGEAVVISGKDFQPNTKFHVLLVYPDSKTLGPYATPVTDAMGNLGVTVKLEEYDGKSLDPGNATLAVLTQDGKNGASTPITLLASGHASYSPVLKVSKNPVIIGNEITLTGSGYPAFASIEVLGGVQNPGIKFGVVKSDDNGNFSYKLKLDVPPGTSGEAYRPGPFNFLARTQDNRLTSNISITLVES